jgi:hypothetical protein
VLSHDERHQFETLSRILAADPQLAGAFRAADRRSRRRRALRWLAPWVVAWWETRYTNRLLTRGR